MNQVIYPKTRALRKLYKRVPCAFPVNGFSTVDDGHEEIYYETSIDIHAMHLLAVKAAGNKSGVSKVGPLSVRVLERRRLV